MNFSDKIIRSSLDVVFVKRSDEEMEVREEYHSNLWDIEKKLGKGVYLYSVPARDVKIGENIYNEKGEFVSYRSA